MLQKTILIVEDEALLLEGMAEIFTMNGYNVVAAQDAASAIALARSLQPDVILCDIGIKSLDGYTIFKETQSFDATAHIPFLFITGFSDTKPIQLRTGVKERQIITKPFQIDRMLATLGDIISGHLGQDFNDAQPCTY